MNAVEQIAAALNTNSTALIISLFLYLFIRMEQMRKELSIMQGKLTVICMLLFGEKNDNPERGNQP